MMKSNSRFLGYFCSISQELLDEDEKDIHDHIESERFYQFATPRKGIFADEPKSEEN